MSAWDDPITHIRELEARLSRVRALADEYDERSRDTETAERYPWGVAADDLRAALEDR